MREKGAVRRVEGKTIDFFCFSFQGLPPQNTRGLLLRVAGDGRHAALAWAPPGTDRDCVFPGLLCASPRTLRPCALPQCGPGRTDRRSPFPGLQFSAGGSEARVSRRLQPDSPTLPHATAATFSSVLTSHHLGIYACKSVHCRWRVTAHAPLPSEGLRSPNDGKFPPRRGRAAGFSRLPRTALRP